MPRRPNRPSRYRRNAPPIAAPTVAGTLGIRPELLDQFANVVNHFNPGVGSAIAGAIQFANQAAAKLTEIRQQNGQHTEAPEAGPIELKRNTDGSYG